MSIFYPSLKAGQLVKKLKNNFEYRELIVQSFIAAVVRSIAAIAAFVFNVVVARYLGAEEAGYFFLALTIITVLSTVGRMGCDNIILRFTSVYSSIEKWNEVQSVYITIIKRTFILSAVIGIALAASASPISSYIFHKEKLKAPIIWMGLSIPFFSLYTVTSYGLQGVKKVIGSVTLQSISVPVILIAFIIMWLPSTADALSRLYLIASIVTVVIGFFWWRKVTKGVTSKHYNSKEIWKSARPMWTYAVLQQCIQWGGQFISGIFIDSKSLAQLAVAQRTSMLISFILIAVNLVSAPKFAAFYYQNKMVELKRYTINTTRLMTFVALPVVIFVCAFPSTIMSIFGEGFADKTGVWILCILSAGQFINVITGSVQYLLIMSGHEKDIRNISILNGILALTLALIFTALFGVLGTAIATALVVACQNILAMVMVKKRLGFSTINIF